MGKVLKVEKFIQGLAKEVGVLVLDRFGKDGMHYMKSENISDVVTQADLMADEYITSRIKKVYPTHGIISEESGNVNTDADFVWVIDPIDGTLNFSRGVPYFGVMMCLVHKGEVVLSVINLPATGELFFAEAGKGAYRNGTQIQCSQHRTLDQSYGAGSGKFAGRTGKLIRGLVELSNSHRLQSSSFGAMAPNVCYTASGGRDWVIALAGSIWDFAPSYLMLKESGCIVTNVKGDPWKFGTLEMVAANPLLQPALLKFTKDL